MASPQFCSVAWPSLTSVTEPGDPLGIKVPAVVNAEPRGDPSPAIATLRSHGEFSEEPAEALSVISELEAFSSPRSQERTPGAADITDDSPGMSVLEMRAKARRLASDVQAEGKRLGMVVVDEADSEEEEASATA